MIRRSALRRFLATSLTTLALGGCAASGARQADGLSSAEITKPLPGPQTDGDAEKLLVRAASCWMGGLWDDALRSPDGAAFRVGGDMNARVATIEQRCNAVLSRVYGAEDPSRYTQLRAAEPHVVDALAARLRALAADDRADRTQADELVSLLQAVASAARENVIARAAADDVKRDYEGPSSRAERMTDKTDAAQALGHVAGIERLLSMRDGRLTPEARGLGLLFALDRLEIARGLPKHLKVVAVGGPFARLFGVAPPSVPADPTAPIRTGTWPGYLAAVADAAGHAVPADADEPIDRESLAWGGVLQAFADRLRVEAGAMSPRTPLPVVLDRVAYRLESENRMTRELFSAERHAER
ncbi:MAG TPA: hypothetical protein VGL81_21775 [Polyangiaceae bacterium]